MTTRMVALIMIASTAFATAAHSQLLGGMSPPIWLVQPASDQGQELTVQVGEWITQTPLLPGGFAELVEDARDEQGRSAALSGDELFLRLVNGEQAFCTYASRRPGTPIGKIGSAETDPCFIDRNGDGQFEVAARVRMLPPATIFAVAPVRERARPIPPVRYRRGDPSKTKHAYSVGVKFDGVYLGGAPVFKVYFGAGGGGIPVTGSMKLARNGTADIFGARFTVLSRDKKIMRVRVDRAIPAQTFALSNGVS